MKGRDVEVDAALLWVEVRLERHGRLRMPGNLMELMS